jgi:ribosome-binding protein aMBF1 (putative translation factor)
MMKENKRRRLKAAGWKIGTAAEFLGLDEAEQALVEVKLNLSRLLRTCRSEQKLSQAALAHRLRSSQSRVAKMEAADRSVSMDLLVRSLFTLGATRKELAKAIGKGE